MILPWHDATVGPGGPVISTSLTEAEAQHLRAMAAWRLVLEVGSAFGYSAIAMSLGGEALGAAQHVLAVDPHRDIKGSLEGMRANLAACGNPPVTIMLGGSQDVLPALYAAGARFHLAFIDGDHAEEAVERDVRYALPLLHPDGALACHDYGEDTCPGVRAALDRLGPPDELVDSLWVQRKANAQWASPS